MLKIITICDIIALKKCVDNNPPRGSDPAPVPTWDESGGKMSDFKGITYCSVRYICITYLLLTTIK